MKKLSIVILFFVLCGGNAFSQGQKKTAFGVLLDNSGSMRSRLDSVIKLGKTLAVTCREHGEVSFFDFSPKTGASAKAKVAGGTDWTWNQKTTNDYLDNQYIVDGETGLYDAIFSMSDFVQSKVRADGGKFSEKILILLTDGEDRGSEIKEEALIKSLKEAGVKVYVIVWRNGDDPQLATLHAVRYMRARRFIDTVTRETGGKIVTQKVGQTTEDIVGDLFSK